MGCPASFFDDGSNGGCALCPWGFWCGGNDNNATTEHAVATACPAGTANPSPGAFSSAACLPCALGTYAPGAGSAVCLACPAGAYCPATGLTAPGPSCPAHTVSTAGARSLGDCACMPNYICTYRRDLVLQLALNTTLTLSQLQGDASIAAALENGVLTAFGLYGLSGVTARFQGFTALAPSSDPSALLHSLAVAVA